MLSILLCGFQAFASVDVSRPTPTPSPQSASVIEPTAPAASWSYVRKQLKLAGLRSDFIEALKANYEDKDLEDVLRLNVLLFLKKSDYHGVQVTEQAAAEVSAFVKDHRSVLKMAESRWSVDPMIVASLLWIESRYGKNLGKFHVPSVYLNLLQAPRKEMQAFLLTQTSRYTDDEITPAIRKKILQRTHDKAKFAIGELFALQKAYRWKWDLSRAFRGSFSGAFGMPQFLPSSYVHFARASRPKAQPALDQPDDAILSVAYFLKMHGWKEKSAASHLKSLRAYNNSLDYANAILSLAAKARAI